VPKNEYKRALDAAVREYEKVSAEHSVLDARLAQLKQSIATLTKLCGYEPTMALGLTEACRMVLRNADQPLTALEVRGRLIAAGFDMERYSNAMASIHTVVKRMHEAGEVTERQLVEGARARAAYLYDVHVLGPRVGPPRRSKPPNVQGLCPPKDRIK
jgi:hypothetical protein